nr:hypothetical protein [Streptomyces zinciresistens]
MMVLALAGLLLLAVGGCVCVVWASRGGPRWVRVVSRVTLALGEAVRASGRSRRSSGLNSGSESGD